MTRTLIAGVGNIFFGDDGFGPEVVRRLLSGPLPDGVRAVDFGIRGVYLAYELTSGWDEAIIVDAVARGRDAGTLYVLDPGEHAGGTVPDGHALDLGAVLSLMRSLGAPPPRVRVVGCEAAEVTARLGLSDTMERAVEPAVALVRRLLEGGAGPPVEVGA